jgi:hypothetical protein
MKHLAKESRSYPYSLERNPRSSRSLLEARQARRSIKLIRHNVAPVIISIPHASLVAFLITSLAATGVVAAIETGAINPAKQEWPEPTVTRKTGAAETAGAKHVTAAPPYQLCRDSAFRSDHRVHCRPGTGYRYSCLLCTSGTGVCHYHDQGPQKN